MKAERGFLRVERYKRVQDIKASNKNQIMYENVIMKWFALYTN